MSANELALRFSTAPAEQLIGILPVLEVKEAEAGTILVPPLVAIVVDHHGDAPTMRSPR